MEQNYVTVTLVYLRSRGCQFRALLRNNSGQVVHTRAPVSKQYKLAGLYTAPTKAGA